MNFVFTSLMVTLWKVTLSVSFVTVISGLVYLTKASKEFAFALPYKSACSLPVIVKFVSRLPVVSRGAKKKEAVHDERVSYLHVAPL